MRVAWFVFFVTGFSGLNSNPAIVGVPMRVTEEVRTSNHFDSLKEPIVLFRWNLCEPVLAEHSHPIPQTIVSLKKRGSVNHRSLRHLYTMLLKHRRKSSNAWEVPRM